MNKYLCLALEIHGIVLGLHLVVTKYIYSSQTKMRIWYHSYLGNGYIKCVTYFHHKYPNVAYASCMSNVIKLILVIYLLRALCNYRKTPCLQTSCNINVSSFTSTCKHATYRLMYTCMFVLYTNVTWMWRVWEFIYNLNRVINSQLSSLSSLDPTLIHPCDIRHVFNTLWEMMLDSCYLCPVFSRLPRQCYLRRDFHRMVCYHWVRYGSWVFLPLWRTFALKTYTVC